ncbi:unnamed protein product [Protopolystoma xenopodis]|uniref:Rho-GAP domain-containing protein n=1 Tax=Protopolystoma xenopodis TaxID=117903 RepID=A0A448WIQ5_9PLAT|nr:unnamed protein product [Protopolystoma xenopodis]
MGTVAGPCIRNNHEHDRLDWAYDCTHDAMNQKIKDLAREFNTSYYKKSKFARPNSKPFIPPSLRLVDPEPSRPTHDSPIQRTICREERPTMQLFLRILATSEQREFKANDMNRHEVARNGFKNRPNKSLFTIAKEVDKINSSGRFEVNRPINWVDLDSNFPATMNIADFRPLSAPFVPNLIRKLVNSIESYCYSHSWNIVYATFSTDVRRMTWSVLRLLLREWDNLDAMDLRIQSITPQLRCAVLRRFLGCFKVKPLHFYKKTLTQIVQRPLFDQFLRPNPQIKTIVRNAVLPTSRTCLDTLAFLMIHLLHAWEYASNPVTTKIRLAEIYGPLIISFADRPTILDRDVSSSKTEEAAILEVIMDVCDSHFWNNLSMLKIRLAFDHLTGIERRRHKQHCKNMQNIGRKLNVGRSIERNRGREGEEGETARAEKTIGKASGMVRSMKTDYIHSSESTEKVPQFGSDGRESMTRKYSGEQIGRKTQSELTLDALSDHVVSLEW